VQNIHRSVEQCVDQLGAFVDSIGHQSRRVVTLQRALNDVASRCAELGAAKTALVKRAQHVEAELVGVGAQLLATKDALALCEREREDAQDEVVRLTDIAAQQQEQSVALQVARDAAQAELARVRAELDAERAAKVELNESVRALAESLEAERANVASARDEAASVAAALSEATELQHELEASLVQCIGQRDRTLHMLQQEQAVVAELQRLSSLTAAAMAIGASAPSPSASTVTPRLAIPARPAFKRQRVLAGVRGGGGNALAAAPSPASQSASAIGTLERERESVSASNSASSSSSGAIRVLMLPE
jgi:chromosome segregation ATPase